MDSSAPPASLLFPAKTQVKLKWLNNHCAISYAITIHINFKIVSLSIKKCNTDNKQSTNKLQNWHFIKILSTNNCVLSRNVCCLTLRITAAYAIIRCPFVYLSFTFVYSVETNKHIFKIFSPSGSHTILVFPHQTLWPYYDCNGNCHNMASNERQVWKIAIFDQ